MSQKTVELAKRTYEAFNRRDLDAVLESFDPDIEAHDPPEMPDSAVHRGREEVRRDWERTFESFEEFTIEVDETHDLGGDRVLMVLRFRGRGAGSGALVEAPVAHLLTMKDGKLLRLRQFLDREAAFEAAGLTQ